METLCRIRALYRELSEFELRFEATFGVSLNEGMALCLLSHGECVAAGALAEALGLTPSNTSKVLRTVEEKGWVTRTLCQQDRRRMYFALTPQGKALLAQIHAHPMELSPALETAIIAASSVGKEG